MRRSAQSLPSLELPRGQEPFAGPTAAGPQTRVGRYLQPGQLVVGADPTTVTTILGSCVSVCLWDRRRGIGAVNHYMFPHATGRVESSGRFGPAAIAMLLERLRGLGCVRPDLEAKIFGGACILAAVSLEKHVGTLNVRVARERLAEARVPVVAEDVGGRRGRRLVFHTDTGLALVQRL